MFYKKLLLILLVLLPLQQVISQSSFGFSSDEILNRLQEDVYTLASDEMEGRESGTPGEVRAAHFIKSRMKEVGLTPLFDGSFLQTFEFPGMLELGEENFMVIHGEDFILEEDFFVLPNSGNGRVYAEGVYVGFGLIQDDYDDYAGLSNLEDKIFFMEIFLPEEMDERGTPMPLNLLAEKIETAEKKGASAIVFVNTQSWRNDPPLRLGRARDTAGIPVLFARDEVFEFWQQQAQGEYIFLSAELYSQTYTSMNVAGYWDNNADYTVVIGGHFDHLGFGGRGSRSPGSREIHYGADDNASGVAGVLEAARYLTQSHHTSNNYLFIAFGAEEKGLIGSRHFTNSDAYDMGRVNYMFNYDMIGRMENGNITLYGTGTSALWESTIDANDRQELSIRKSPSGIGGSDHTSFYLKDIPVMFFFTGIHDDYHRPTDTPDKINYEGMSEILRFSFDMIADLDSQGKLEFSSTPVTRRGQPQRRGAGPTLGLMPDHAFQGEGVKVLGIVENRPAQRAGLKEGDVIIKIDENPIPDIEEYMRVMGSFQANQKINVMVNRNEDQMEIEVEL